MKLYEHVFRLAIEQGAIVGDDSGDIEYEYGDITLYYTFDLCRLGIPNKIRISDIIKIILGTVVIECQYKMFKHLEPHITEKSYKVLLSAAIRQKENKAIIKDLLWIDHYEGEHLLTPEIYYGAIEQACLYDRPEYIKMLMKRIDDSEIACKTFIVGCGVKYENIDLHKHMMNKDLKYYKIFKFIGRHADFSLLQLVIDRSKSYDVIDIQKGIREAHANAQHTMVNKLLGMMPVIPECSQMKVIFVILHESCTNIVTLCKIMINIKKKYTKVWYIYIEIY